jgi:hypothetical protein
MKQTSAAVLAVIVKAAVLFPACSAFLWWESSMGLQGRDGWPPIPDALQLVLEMGGILTFLTVIVWLIAPRIHRRISLSGLAIRTTLETAAILLAYVALVCVWRDTWTPARGMTESAAFMPFLGHVNAEFLAEVGPIGFAIAVVPFVAILSGVLTFGVEFLQRKYGLNFRASMPE